MEMMRTGAGPNFFGNLHMDPYGFLGGKKGHQKPQEPRIGMSSLSYSPSNSMLEYPILTFTHILS